MTKAWSEEDAKENLRGFRPRCNAWAVEHRVIFYRHDNCHVRGIKPLIENAIHQS